jgi:hypothetical protein
MLPTLVLLLAPLQAPMPPQSGPRVVEVGPGGRFRDSDPASNAVGRTTAPLPVGWLGGTNTLIMRKDEEVLLKAMDGRKIKSVVIDRGGIVDAKALSPTTVRLRGLETGRVRLTVELED